MNRTIVSTVFPRLGARLSATRARTEGAARPWTAQGLAVALAALLLAALSAACGADPTGDPGFGPDAGPDDPEAPVRLTVDPVLPTTYWPAIPVKGRGPASGTLLISTEAGGQKPHDLGSDGTFCVDATLASGKVNDIVLEAIAPDGRHSPEVVIQVRQDGEPPTHTPPPSPGTTIENISLNSTEFAGNVEAVDSTQLQALTDGDHSGMVVIENTWYSAFEWFSFRLDQAAPMVSMRIVSDGLCPLTDYHVYVTDYEGDPGMPKEGVKGWRKVTSIGTALGATEGVADQEILPPLTLGKPMARHIGIEIGTYLPSCSGWAPTPTERVSEIQVWAEVEADDDDDEREEVAYPDCASGG